MEGSRSCMASLPEYLKESQAPRVGPMSRAGFERDTQGAGHLLFAGEHDRRIAPDFDAMRGLRKGRAASLDVTRPRIRSPQPEPRVRDIDQKVGVYRSGSVSETTRAVKSLPMQMFGVLPAIDENVGGRRRCISPRPVTVTRQESIKRATHFGDIEGVQSKKLFNGASSPLRSPSPQGIAMMKSLDIDAPTGKGKARARSPASGTLPTDSPSYCLTCPGKYLESSSRASPRTKSYDYFEQVLSADRYAQLIGRPHVQTDEHEGIGMMNLAPELRKHKKYNPAWIKDMEAAQKELTSSAGSTTASGSTTPSMASMALDHFASTRPMMHDAQMIASKLNALHSDRFEDEEFNAMRLELEDQQLSSLHKRALAEGASIVELANAMDSENQRTEYIQLILAMVSKKEQNQPKVALALRRVVASLLPTEDVSEGMANDLKAAFCASAKALNKMQDLRINQKMNLTPRSFSPRNLTPRCRAGY